METIIGNRRDFLKFIGASAALAGVAPAVGFADSFLSSGALLSLPATIEDSFKVIPSFSWEVVLKWGDTINNQGDLFGFNNDFLAYIPLNKDEAILWANHEYVHPLLVSGHIIDENFHRKTKEQAQVEMKAVGGSLVHLKRNKNRWELVKDSPYNKRIDAFTKIPFSSQNKIKGSAFALGTFGNCAGGVTPWMSVLSCEENYHNFVGEVEYDAKNNGVKKNADWVMGWDIHFDYPPEHYGWVVEINPKTAEAKKLVALGRFIHEGATCVTTKNGKVVVYMGEDKDDGCFFKFVSKNKTDLNEGELFVANVEQGTWISLDYNKNDKLKKRFKNQTEVLIRSSEAAQLVGGSKLDRPEDCEIDPKTGTIFLNCTNNFSKDRPYGSILKFNENGDFDSLTFKSSLFIADSLNATLACPDNIAIDKKGNLWITSDISESKIGKAPYEKYGNNALFYIPMSGKKQGQIYRVAQAPIDAELTGPCFSEDGETLFLSVQHPGASSKSLNKLSSHWPDGGTSIPKPSVVAIKIPKELRE